MQVTGIKPETWRESWSSCYSLIAGSGLESQDHILDGHFVTLICCTTKL